MLRACCCPQKNAVAPAAIVPSQAQTAHSSAQEAQSQSEAALVSKEGDNGPSAEDVDDYARNVLGMDVEKHPHLIWIAEEALLQIDLPKGWVERIDATGRAFYENKSTKETTFVNPIDTAHRELYQLQVMEMGMDVEKHPQVETNCAPQACVPVVVAVPVEAAQP